VETVSRIEAPYLIGGLVRFVRYIDLAQDALLMALECWPNSGIPINLGARLVTAAKNRGIDLARRRTITPSKHPEVARL